MWDEIEQIVGLTGDALDEDGQYTGKWQFFGSLLFLKGIVAPRTTEGNVSHIEASQESQISLLDNDDIEDEQFSDENSANVDFSSQVSVTADISQVVAKDGISKVNTNRGSLRVNKSPRELVSEATNMSSSSTATSRLKRTSRREENIAVEQQLLNIETKKLALLQTPEDENSLFLRSLLPYFQKMDPLQQLRVRNKFQETLINEMSPPFTNLQPGNTHYPDRPSTASSVHSLTYSNVCSPPTTSFQAGNTQYYSDCPITAGSSLHSSTYLDVSSPPSTAQGSRAQNIMSLLKDKRNATSGVSDQQQESLLSASTSSPTFFAGLESSFKKKTSELLDNMNLEFIDRNAVEFVVEQNGELTYVNQECNAENYSHAPISEPDYIPVLVLVPDIEPKNKSQDTNTYLDDIQFEASALDPDYIHETEFNNLVNDDPDKDANDPDGRLLTLDPDYVPNNEINSGNSSSVSEPVVKMVKLI
ncbi:hypothetical protein RN001_005763 [Aquatica leii]|uniref:BESS domain-containing protein n=1 Tax=Aquatica leii TaxID=1421715 RepID=A0AAN7PCS7_9COLE|nr:hypothetical protein RN001_005763 [Aquatica leii]